MPNITVRESVLKNGECKQSWSSPLLFAPALLFFCLGRGFVLSWHCLAVATITANACQVHFTAELAIAVKVITYLLDFSNQPLPLTIQTGHWCNYAVALPAVS